MEKKFRRSLFLFRRDLRLEDNTGLIFALKSSEVVIPAFIFTLEQIERNPFRSDHCLKFMIESLKDLENQLKEKGGKLFLFKGKPEEVVSKCMRKLNIEALIVNRDYTPYSRQRDNKLEKVCKAGQIPLECSTYLSPYLKFTVCSPREVYEAICRHLSPHHELIRSLYWRDFFTSIAFFFPHVFMGAFHSKFDKLKWSYNRKAYQRWCEGSTGFPIVDAGMREMNETGFMHNRVRMIAASFLIKDLHIDWRWGEKYFAQTLIDYDPAVNNGNWQWAASTGSDAQPYFRIFNPWNQQKKFDPECTYIKKWIPELRDFPPKAIHAWYEEKHRAGCKKYPAPMTNHDKAAKEALHAYRSI